MGLHVVSVFDFDPAELEEEIATARDLASSPTPVRSSIFLGCGRLNLLPALYQTLLAPEAVWREVVAAAFLGTRCLSHHDLPSWKPDRERCGQRLWLNGASPAISDYANLLGILRVYRRRRHGRRSHQRQGLPDGSQETRGQTG